MMGDFARNIRATTHERGKMNDTTVRPHPRPLSRTDAFNNTVRSTQRVQKFEYSLDVHSSKTTLDDDLKKKPSSMMT
jgi:hypothetical protein